MNLQQCYFCKAYLIPDKNSTSLYSSRYTCPNCSDDIYLPFDHTDPRNITMCNEIDVGIAAFWDIKYGTPTVTVINVDKYEPIGIATTIEYYIRLNELILKCHSDINKCFIQCAKTAKIIVELPNVFNLLELSPKELYNKLKLYITYS